MRIAAHITFFYDEKRLVYLHEVIDHLLQIDAQVDIYIYTNQEFTINKGHATIKTLIFPYSAQGKPKFSYKSIVKKLGFDRWIHPFYLTWEHRKVVEEQVNNYDIQLYLEDDIKFTADNLTYWLNYHEKVAKQGYNLGFLRTEVDGADKFVTDLMAPLHNIITLDGKKYVLNDNNPYYGFWIYDQKELQAFIKSKEWRFKIKGYGIREMAAIGWHGVHMNRYKGTVIPLEQIENKWVTLQNCQVHHLPNNYIGHEIFCTCKFPLVVESEHASTNA